MTNTHEQTRRARHVSRAEAGDVDGAVVAIDVLRAFTTAAYAFAAGAHVIVLVGSVAEALHYEHCLDVDRFDFAMEVARHGDWALIRRIPAA